MMAPPRIVLICGLSGVGKTRLIREYIASHGNAASVSAGTLISRARGDANRDTLRGLEQDDLTKSQELLVTALRNWLTEISSEFLFLDGHVLIDAKDAAIPYVVPLTVFEQLQLDGIVHVRADPRVIFERRRDDALRVRPSRTIEELRRHQSLSAERALLVSHKLGLSHVECDSDAMAIVNAFVSNIRASL